MKKALPFFMMIALLGIIANISAQSALNTNQPLIWGPSPFQDSLWSFDTTSWNVVHRVAPSLAGFTITGMNGLAADPTDGQVYGIAKVSGVLGRVLVRISLPSGVCTPVNGTPTASSLGDNFSTITFREDGQLFGVTGDGANVPETMYLIDKNTATKTLAAALGAGADGEIICYNRDDNFFYHWSGNGTGVMEKIMSVAPYSTTNIPITGTPGGETFGSLYIGNNKFINSNISSQFVRVNTNGVYGAQFGSNPDDVRGMVMTPYFTASSNSFCQHDTLSMTAGGHQLYSHLIFHWGDASFDSVTTSYGVLANASHVYSAPGTYTVNVVTWNGFVGDTIYSYIVNVLNIPTVTLSGSSVSCGGDSVTLTGSGGGTSQWYFNGNPIVGAATNTYSTNTPGVYNMIKTNLNGCSDSAATGISLTVAPYPVVNLGGDTTQCGGSVVLDAGNSGLTFLWSDSSTAQTFSASASGMYYVTVTDSLTCSTTDTIAVTINALPVVSISALQSVVCVNNPPIPLTGSPAGGTFSGNGVTPNTFTPSAAGPGMWMATYSFTDSLGCTSSDATPITVNALPTVSVTAASSTVCFDDANVVLTGVPSGGTFSGPGVSGNQLDPSVAGNGTQTVNYTFTDTNNCSASATTSVTVDPCVGVIENVLTPFTMFPNPSNGIITLNLNYSNSLVEVVDVLGNTVSSQRYVNSGQIQLNLNYVAEGIYIVRVTSGNEKSVQKLIIRR